jgi:hypothetical protein
MNDTEHRENVAPMVTACELTGTKLSEAANVFCYFWALNASGQATDAPSPGDLHFAAGYLQATSNLTGESWADQLERVKKEMTDG